MCDISLSKKKQVFRSSVEFKKRRLVESEVLNEVFIRERLIFVKYK